VNVFELYNSTYLHNSASVECFSELLNHPSCRNTNKRGVGTITWWTLIKIQTIFACTPQVMSSVNLYCFAILFSTS
jgi:hypothetical protein